MTGASPREKESNTDRTFRGHELKKESERIKEQKLDQLIGSVPPPDREAMTRAAERQSRLAKPPGSFGRLEELSVQLAGITGRWNNRFDKKQLLVFAADNGVTAEGVSSAPKSVTRKQAVNIAHGRSGAGVLAAHYGCGITVCDVGIDAELNDSFVLNCKIGFGTGNIAAGPAMTRDQALTALLTGAELASSCDADLVGIGEMGIGNTTTSSAVLAALLHADAALVAGRGGGITDAMFERKKEVIRQATDVNKPDAEDVIDVLSKVGGFDLAAMCGAYLGAAAVRRPAVIDGFISAVAALCAVRLCPGAAESLIPSHASDETGFRLAMQALGLRPYLMLDMRLGEGSGCPLMFLLVDAACVVINNMITFEEASIDDGYLDAIRDDSCFRNS